LALGAAEVLQRKVADKRGKIVAKGFEEVLGGFGNKKCDAEYKSRSEEKPLCLPGKDANNAGVELLAERKITALWQRYGQGKNHQSGNREVDHD